tara:strand:+ start:1751 stop:2395 length:645 start_codon:yes stop_codon:yes gene_type:complete
MSYSSSNVSRSELLMSSLQVFFKKTENINKILPIINGTSKISLRVIDWFVTNYSKKNNTSYFINSLTGKILKNIDNYNPDYCKQFLVYIDYKLQLKGYQKKQFDPFCRRSRINFYYENNKFFVTTVGQLNFFRWVITNKILDYITENLKDIETDMNTCYKSQYTQNKKSKSNKSESSNDSKAGGSKSRRKRQELSISASKSLSKTNVKVVVSFD